MTYDFPLSKLVVSHLRLEEQPYQVGTVYEY